LIYYITKGGILTKAVSNAKLSVKKSKNVFIFIRKV